MPRHVFILFLTILSLLLIPSFLQADNQFLADNLQLARQGDPEAQFSLGLLYDTGRESERNPEQAIYWFTRAAEAGIGGACLYLGMKYEFGTGVPQNRAKAQHWYKQAALQGWPQAAFLSGTLYLSQPRPDPVQGCAWLKIAADQKFPGAEQQWQHNCTMLNKTSSRKTAALLKELRKHIYGTKEH